MHAHGGRRTSRLGHGPVGEGRSRQAGLGHLGRATFGLVLRGRGLVTRAGGLRRHALEGLLSMEDGGGSAVIRSYDTVLLVAR